MEISNCVGVSITFCGAVPAITQLDPEIDGLEFHFERGCQPGSFIVALRPPSANGIGLKQVAVSLAPESNDVDAQRRHYVFVDQHGRIDNALIISSGGTLSEQYKIDLIRDGDHESWKMVALAKKAGMPVVNTP